MPPNVNYIVINQGQAAVNNQNNNMLINHLTGGSGAAGAGAAGGAGVGMSLNSASAEGIIAGI